MKRRTEITIETDRIVLVTQKPERHVIWCVSCAAQVVPLTIDEATIKWRISSLTLFHHIESRLVHYFETADGLLLVCPHSMTPPDEEGCAARFASKPYATAFPS